MRDIHLFGCACFPICGLPHVSTKGEDPKSHTTTTISVILIGSEPILN